MSSTATKAPPGRLHRQAVLHDPNREAEQRLSFEVLRDRGGAGFELALTLDLSEDPALSDMVRLDEIRRAELSRACTKREASASSWGFRIRFARADITGKLIPLKTFQATACATFWLVPSVARLRSSLCVPGRSCV